MDLSNKRVVILGAKRSGQALARLIKKLGGFPKISDKGDKSAFSDEFQLWAEGNNVPLESGRHSREFVQDSDLMILSPGVSIGAEAVGWVREKGIPIMGEIELAFRLCPCPIIAVTGSNGKTTVVTLIKEILQKAQKKVCLCGNVGLPFSQFVLDLKGYDYVVLEISSFQLETIIDFKPKVAVFLNFSQNHLDRHKDLEEYFDAKKRIFMNQDAGDIAVLNAADFKVRECAEEIRSKIVYFNSPSDFKEFRIQNPNFLAALKATQALGISFNICYEVFNSFPGVEHRMEKVRTLEGIDYINDSKATTAEAGRWALQRIDQPIIWICGGRDKNIDFSVLKDLARSKVKVIIAIGEARKKIKDTFSSVIEVKESNSMQDAVSLARQLAKAKDCVLLSPMCASFDMFKDYEDRGRVFKNIVNQLI